MNTCCTSIVCVSDTCQTQDASLKKVCLSFIRYQILPCSQQTEISVHLIRAVYVHTKLFSCYPQNENSEDC